MLVTSDTRCDDLELQRAWDGITAALEGVETVAVQALSDAIHDYLLFVDGAHRTGAYHSDGIGWIDDIQQAVANALPEDAE